MKITQITIKKFRGIKEQTISDIGEALVLIGKNNSGKSAVLTAIRAFWGDYTPQPKDFYRNSSSFEILITFEISDEYLLYFFNDSKVGFQKLPSTKSDYNDIKDGTLFKEVEFDDFKRERSSIRGELSEDISVIEKYGDIWLKALKNKFHIINNTVTISAVCQQADLKVNYTIGETTAKDFVGLFPTLAFIDDSRNFDDEETGKSKTITAKIFGQIMKTELVSNISALQCETCSSNDCEIRCLSSIFSKSPDELTIEELKKLINYKAKNSSENITKSISEKFSNNYRENFRINIKATSSIDKSFSIATKIYDPDLGEEVDLSNVGAGVRSIYILSLLQAYQEIRSSCSIFIVEEPELYLHPELQKSMAKTLSLISEKSQVIFTTHSPIMLREFGIDEIRKVHMDSGHYESTIMRTTIDDVLNEIGYSTQDIIQSDFVLFVEGPDDKKVFELVLQKYYNIDLNRIKIVDTKSCRNLSFYATLRFLGMTTLKDDFAIIRDADMKDVARIKDEVINSITENMDSLSEEMLSDRVHITKYSSLEGYLFSPELLVTHNLYPSTESVFHVLQQELSTKKEKCINEFRRQNRDEDRIRLFEENYDSKVRNPSENLEWIKTYIRGHTYFGFTRSQDITFDEYVNNLPQNAFQDLIEFFDSLEYFKDKSTHT